MHLLKVKGRAEPPEARALELRPVVRGVVAQVVLVLVLLAVVAAAAARIRLRPGPKS